MGRETGMVYFEDNNYNNNNNNNTPTLAIARYLLLCLGSNH